VSSHLEDSHRAYLDVVQRVGDELISEFAAVCRANHIEFFVHAGTLRNAVEPDGLLVVTSLATG